MSTARNVASNNPMWRGGVSDDFYTKRLKPLLGDCCSKCGSKNDLHVHHRDENHRNNVISNVTLLCRSCHAKEHEFWKHLGKPAYLKPIPCLFCATLFQPSSSQRKYCSNECYRKSPFKKPKVPIVKCRNCKKPFKQTADRRTFCSPACYHADRA